MATSFGKPEQCEKIIAENPKNEAGYEECIADVALYTHNKSVCSILKTSQKTKDCERRIF
jgi:hypothetical protein